MKEIKLTQGKVALVDDEDFEYLNQWQWCAHKSYNTFYTERNVTISCGKTKTIKMHRLIVNCKIGMQVDHIFGNGLDNRKSKLRICTPSQNIMTQRPRTNASSRFRGVSLHKRDNNWRATIFFNKKAINIGLFSIEEDAAIAYNEAAKKYFGEFARLNIIS